MRRCVGRGTVASEHCQGDLSDTDKGVDTNVDEEFKRTFRLRAAAHLNEEQLYEMSDLEDPFIKEV